MRKEILRLEHIDLYENDYRALDDFNLNVLQGELISAFGFLGCGAEQLVSLLAGRITAERGKILFDEKAYTIHKKITTEKLGIFIMERDNALVPDFSVAENIYVLWGMQVMRVSVPTKGLHLQTKSLLEEFELDIQAEQLAKELSEAQQQAIKLVKAYAKQAKLVVINNIADNYTKGEIQLLLRIIQKVRKQGTAVLWLSYKPDMITAVADRVTLLSRGKNIKTFYGEDYRSSLGMGMLAGEVSLGATTSMVAQENPVLVMENICTGNARKIILDAKPGEIVGILDSENTARNDLIHVLLGKLHTFEGQMRLSQKDFAPRNYLDAVRQGVGYVSGGTLDESLLPNMSIVENLMIPVMKRTSRLLFTNGKVKRYLRETYAPMLGISVKEMDASISILDRHQLRKLLYLRWMLYAPKLQIVDEPFAFTDLPMRNATIQLIRDFAKEETAVLLFTVSMEGLTEACDRIVRIKHGEIAGTYTREQFDLLISQ